MAPAAVLAAALALAPGCGSDPEQRRAPEGFSEAALERDLTRLMAQRTGAVVDRMACEEITPRPGLRLECSALFDGEAGVIDVVLREAGTRPGTYTAKLRNVLLGRLEQAIQRRLGQLDTPVTSVDCPGPVPQRSGQVSFCDVVDRRGGSGRLRVTQTDDQGNIRLERVSPAR